MWSWVIPSSYFIITLVLPVPFSVFRCSLPHTSYFCLFVTFACDVLNLHCKYVKERTLFLLAYMKSLAYSQCSKIMTVSIYLYEGRLLIICFLKCPKSFICSFCSLSGFYKLEWDLISHPMDHWMSNRWPYLVLQELYAPFQMSLNKMIIVKNRVT